MAVRPPGARPWRPGGCEKSSSGCDRAWSLSSFQRANTNGWPWSGACPSNEAMPMKAQREINEVAMKFRLGCTLLLLPVCFWLFACHGDSSSNDPKTVLTGFVVETPGGAPVPESAVRVSQTGRTVRTDAAGRFRLSIEPGSFSITVDQPGFAQTVWTDLGPDAAGSESLVLVQPKAFCDEWEALAPEIEVSGLEPGQTVSGVVHLEIRAVGARPMEGI
ncbi:MAG: carboxypeptidase regulatory-like domain-containing protein, partial [Deltaproteobacteria bacterium]|nr:carboxypeptidase regulatory-like domain-containing protein [Deltaproteobacteria bacterium]